MIAKIIADKKLEKKYKPATEIKDNVVPKINACLFLTFPSGIGRRQVLDIIPSISASYHMFSAPAAPAPRATNNSDKAELTKLILIGAITIPTNAVKMTKDITLGFINSKKFFKVDEYEVCDDINTPDICFFKIPLLFYLWKLIKLMERRW